MRISSITLQNFRCFGSEATTIPFNDTTALIGGNGSGKTAVLLALSRVFGVAQNERRILLEDFHVPSGKTRDKLEEIELMIEVRIDFPELEEDEARGIGVPQCFNQMIVSEEGEIPYCRVRLEATWTRSNLPQGDIEEKTWWVTTADEEVDDSSRFAMPNYARSMIHVLYVPAFRDAARQLSHATGSLFYRLFRAIEWSDETREAIKDSSDAIRKSVHSEASIKHIHECLSDAWTALHDSPVFKNVFFQPVGGALDQILQQVEAVFSPGEDGAEHRIERLSDGLKSLFYFALVSSVFDVEENVKREAGELDEDTQSREEAEVEEGGDNKLSISFDQLKPPALTVFAVEEPENHLAPYYLNRILKLLKRIARSHSGQVILTSHSPSIMARIDPEDVVYLRQIDTHVSVARRIELPSKTDEAFKFVKEAVRAYPELYFARIVVLGEGDSEELVIPRISKALRLDLNESFAAVVPLGGRFVNHFWRLLRSLDIPHVTLLDLDRERLGGGWSRIHYVIQQLLDVGVERNELLRIEEGGRTKVLSEAEFEGMKTWPASKPKDLVKMDSWITKLETHSVFFSSPLDLDFAMLRSFPKAYQEAWDGEPQIPMSPSAEYDERIKRACIATLKGEDAECKTFTDAEKRDFIWYSYLFIGKGKPTTHLMALGKIGLKELGNNCPEVLKRLIAKMTALLNPNGKDH